MQPTTNHMFARRRQVAMQIAVLLMASATAIIVLPDAPWYAQTAVEHIQREAQNSIPLPFELERARAMLRSIEETEQPDLFTRLAQERARLSELDQEFVEKEKDLGKKLQAMKTLREAERAGCFRFGGREYSPAEIREDIVRRFSRYKADKAALDSIGVRRDASERTLRALESSHTGLIETVAELEASIVELEARLAVVSATEAGVPSIDTGDLNRLRDLINRVSAAVEVKEQLAPSSLDEPGLIPVDNPHADQIDELDDLLAKGTN